MSPGFLPSPGSGPWRRPPRPAGRAARAGAARFNRAPRGRPRLGERLFAISARGGAPSDVTPGGGADWPARPGPDTCPPAIGPWRSRGGSARGGTVSRRVRRRWPCACPRYRGQPGHGERRELPGPCPSALPRVFQVLDSQYGTYVWPCAVVLAQYVWAHRRSLPDKRVLEIGAGVSLPGVVAARCGAQVILSDSEELPQCLQSCRSSCIMNRLPHVPVLGLTWGRVSPELLSLAPIDIILGSDVFFDPKGTLMFLGIFGL
ncbi:hypothetical protein Nmel_016184 [Mimus melanotis]